MIFQNLFPVVRPEGDQIAFWLDTSGGEFVKDDTKTVGQLLSANGLKLVKFVRYKIGEIS